MAYREIVTLDDETFLRKKSRPVTEYNERLWRLLDDMHDTLVRADGVGLAAPQVGVLRQICIVETDDLKVELINPKITESSDDLDIGIEGCLSIPDVRKNVPRPKRVVCSAFDRNGKPITIEAFDFDARAVCHEVDHLSGILYIDKAVDE